MKKVMLVIPIVVALSFFVSLIAVSSSVAAQATKTGSTTPKQVPAQKPAPQLAKDKLIAHSTNFWDFEFVRLEVKGVVINRAKGVSYDVHVKVGEIVKFTVHYKVKTPPIKDIYEADASVWGSGTINYTNILSIWHGQKDTKLLLSNNKNLPKFTWENVQFWKKSFIGTSCHTWNEEVVFQWIPDSSFLGENVSIIEALCLNCGDSAKRLGEIDVTNNGFTRHSSNFIRVYIYVTP